MPEEQQRYFDHLRGRYLYVGQDFFNAAHFSHCLKTKVLKRPAFLQGAIILT